MSVKNLITSDKQNSIASLDDRILYNHTPTFGKKIKPAMKISLPSWRVERSRDSCDFKTYQPQRNMSYSDFQIEPQRMYRKKNSNDSIISPVFAANQRYGGSNRDVVVHSSDMTKGNSITSISAKAEPIPPLRMNPKISLTTDFSSCVIDVDNDDLIISEVIPREKSSDKSPGLSERTIRNESPRTEAPQSSFSFC